MRKKIFTFCILATFKLVSAQSDTVQLNEVNLSDSHLLRFTETQSKTVISDSILQRNGLSATALLNFNSLVYLKENGAGMVASPSFRGTTASQTAVIWNGININSQFLGQMDFNTLNTTAFDNLVIKPGGGSIGYGSGAIGGSIHLNNEIRFNQGLEHQIFGNYGSFNSYAFNLKSTYSNENLSLNLALGRAGSDNDYEILNTDRKNSNGQFYNNTLSVSAAYKFNRRNTLKFYGNLFDGKRHFAMAGVNSLQSKYDDYNTRSMIEWAYHSHHWTSNLKIVHLSEEFRYYPTLQTIDYDFGDADTWMAKYDLGVKRKDFSLNAMLEFSHTEGIGSEIIWAKRQIASASLLWKHSVNPRFLYEASVRQEFTDSYNAPFLYSFGLKWQAAEFYQIKVNSSKNFRMPTFNDLFWPGSGNLHLKPETSVQAELSNQFKVGNFSLDLLGYFNSVRDLLQWIPSGNLWTPENIGKVRIYGIESVLNYTKKWKNSHLELNASYAYTVSENEETGKQLMYVPFHKATASVGYSFKRISAYYQFMTNGEVFTDTQNQNRLNAYSVSNLGLEYALGKNRHYKIGGQLLNLWNEDYQNVLNRPMPGRNYNVYLNLKF